MNIIQFLITCITELSLTNILPTNEIDVCAPIKIFMIGVSLFIFINVLLIIITLVSIIKIPYINGTLR